MASGHATLQAELLIALRQPWEAKCAALRIINAAVVLWERDLLRIGGSPPAVSSAIWCFQLASCASKPAPSSVVPPIPPRAPPVAPEANKLRDQITAADKSAAMIDAGAKEARKAATAARVEAERLKTQKTATEAELTKLWQDLQTIESRNPFLETETSRLAANLTDARDTAAKLQEHAAVKDAEADGLRAGHTHVKAVMGDYATQLAGANKTIEA